MKRMSIIHNFENIDLKQIITNPHTNFDDYRFERKFYNENLPAWAMENIIKLHFALFSEIFHQRIVNNIYFDTENLDLFKANYNGHSQRYKIRIRWYGEMFGQIEHPVLEIKIRNGLLNRKESYPIKPFKLDQGFHKKIPILSIFNSEVPIHIKRKIEACTPVLLNQYIRKYFLSFDKNFRITIDKEMKFYKIQRFENYFANQIANKMDSILELKYSPENDNLANRITNQFPFRLTKSSKYMVGMYNIYNPMGF